MADTIPFDANHWSIVIVSYQHSMPYQHNKGFIFGTTYNITYQSDEDLQPQIEAELKKVNQTFSTFETQLNDFLD